jgi:putative ABC transport system substrate-binding protein
VNLPRLMPEVDVMLALPDPTIINAQLIQSILPTTDRYRVPVIGYSQGYVDAGMLGAVFSTPAQVAQQADEITGELVRHGQWFLPEPAYPKYFSVKVNATVARSLEIPVPDEASLPKQLVGEGSRP